MTIDGAIGIEKREQIKCENDIGLYKRKLCRKHSKQKEEYHRQIAEWLEDYKRIKMLIPIEQALKAEYNKAIDDFMKKSEYLLCENLIYQEMEDIAEQLKEGAGNGIDNQ